MDEEQVDQEVKDVQTSEDRNTDELEKVDAEYRMNEKTYALEPISDADSKVILLTIDDAPDKYALEMAKTLKEFECTSDLFCKWAFY